MSIFENILSEPPNNSIFRNNINPFRVGTIFISVLDDIQTRFSQNKYSCDKLKQQIMKNIFEIFSLYHDP